MLTLIPPEPRLMQGGHNLEKPGKPGKVREFEKAWKNLEKSGNFLAGQGIFRLDILRVTT